MTEPLINVAPTRAVVGEWLLAAALLALALGLIGLWLRPMGQVSPEPARVALLEAQIAEGIAAVGRRLDALEGNTARSPAPSDEARVDQKTDAAPMAALVQLGARLDAVEAALARDRTRPADDTWRPLAERIDALERRPDPPAATASGPPSGTDTLAAQATALAARLDKLEAETEKVLRRAGRADRMTRLREMEASLAAGRPLGEFRDAPDPLSRFAATNPPTEARLRGEFPTLARAVRARARAEPSEATMWDRLKPIVIIRRDDGSPPNDMAEPALARARQALDAGDLGAADQALSDLPSWAEPIMASWRADARAILAARAALRDLMGSE